MFKRFFLALVAVSLMWVSASARDEYAHSASVLPKAAQTVLSANFKAKVTVVKIDKEFGRIDEYEVILSNGSEVTFDRDGNWKSVEVAENKRVPSFFIPDAIADYVKKNHRGHNIIGIEKKAAGYEVELSGDLDLKFNKNGQFVRFD